MVKPQLCNCLAVLQICSFGTLKYTTALREGQVSVDSEKDVVEVLLNSYKILRLNLVSIVGEINGI